MVSRSARPKFDPPAIACRSLEDADRLLAQLGDLDAREASAKAECKAAQDQALHVFHERLFVCLPAGARLAFDDRRRQIRDALKLYAEAHHEEISLDGAKSRKLNFGTLGWRKSRDSIEALDEEAGNPTVLDRLSDHLRGALSKFAKLCGPVLDCLTIQIKWSRSKLGAAAADRRVKPAELRSIGFKFVEGGDEFFCAAIPARLTSLSEGAD